MDKIFERIMNFINENTMLLIIICIFLIVILVIYLIDNTIKSKKLEKAELESNNTPEPTVIDNPIPEESVVQPVVEPTPEVVEPVPEEPTVSPVVEPVEETYISLEDTPVTPVVDSSIEDLLNKDYSANNNVVDNISNEPKVEPPKSKYNNDKKLSDIFGKKSENKKIETTQDFSDELDKILKKLNEEGCNS